VSDAPFPPPTDGAPASLAESRDDAPARQAPSADYDAVVIGGALAGASAAILLKRRRPEARVLLVERQERFGRKVGEATVETSAYFLEHVLGQVDHLRSEQLPKHGLRFWFADRPGRRLDEMTEIGARRPPSLPSWQLDRAKLDEAVLAAAREAGVEVARPAKVTAVELGRPESRLTVEPLVGTGDDRPDAGRDGSAGDHAAARPREVRARWVLDASGRQAFLARRLRLLSRHEDHPTAAMWARWRGAASLDRPPFAAGADGGGPGSLPPMAASRRQATNHFCGYGWWCWVIPLAGGDTSVGLVHHKQLFTPAGDGPLAERYRAFVTSRPGLREILAPAEMADDDFHAYAYLPYRTARYAAPGWALLGDAASFMDPYYSPGLDHLAMSVFATVELVADDLDGRLGEAALAARVAEHDRRFRRSYDRWLEALYLGKYELMGDAELTACAYLVDTALYYLGIVTPIYRHPAALAHPAFGLSIRQSGVAFRFMRRFNRRMNRLARLRRTTGRYGRKNAGWRKIGPSPGLGLRALPMLAAGVALWLRLEAQHVGDYLLHRLRRGRPDLSRPVADVSTP